MFLHRQKSKHFTKLNMFLHVFQSSYLNIPILSLRWFRQKECCCFRNSRFSVSATFCRCNNTCSLFNFLLALNPFPHLSVVLPPPTSAVRMESVGSYYIRETPVFFLSPTLVIQRVSLSLIGWQHQ
jgi:hypothetical protein